MTNRIITNRISTSTKRRKEELLEPSASDRLSEISLKFSTSGLLRLTEDVDDDSVNELIDQMSIVNIFDNTKQMEIDINTNGGSISAGFRLLTFINRLSNPILTIVSGMACSMGALIATLHVKTRIMTNTGRLMFHAGSSGVGGKVGDMEPWINNLKETNELIIDLLTKRTGAGKANIRKLITDKDIILTPKEALALNLIDEIVPMV